MSLQEKEGGGYEKSSVGSIDVGFPAVRRGGGSGRDRAGRDARLLRGPQREISLVEGLPDFEKVQTHLQGNGEEGEEPGAGALQSLSLKTQCQDQATPFSYAGRGFLFWEDDLHGED